jgi:hypothetical protein
MSRQGRTVTDLPAEVAERYREAGLDPATLGVAIEHHQAADGRWIATLALSDLLVALHLAVTRPPWPFRLPDPPRPHSGGTP